MNSSEAKDLFKQFKSNDKNAITRLYNAYSRRLYNFAFAYLKTEEDAMDVVQEVFISIWNKRDTLNDETNLEAYLFTVTKNSVNILLSKKKPLKKNTWITCITRWFISIPTMENNTITTIFPIE